MSVVRYPVTPERVILGDVEPAQRVKAMKACASTVGKFAWLRMDVCVSRRGPKPKTERVASSIDVIAILREFAEQYMNLQEFFGVLCLDVQNQPVGFAVLSVGGVNNVFADTRLLFKPVLLSASSGMIITHNHPSGKAYPSAEDVELTEKAAAGAKILGLKLLDHVIVAEGETFSFLDNGKMPR